MVTVIIPTYNRATTVARAIESALNQIGVEKEVIVVDDGSVDETRQVVARYSLVKYVWQPNRRQAAARNTGLAYAKGDYVASLDSDDCWDDDFLLSSINALSKTGADFVFSNHRICNSHGDVVEADHFGALPYMPISIDQSLKLSVEETRSLFLRHCPAPSSSLLMSRDLVGLGWDEQARISDDWFLILAAVLEKGACCVVQRRPSWSKSLGGDNICDGHQDHFGLALKEIQDCRRLLQIHASRFRFQEKRELLGRLATSMDDAAYFAGKKGRLAKMLSYELSALWMLPDRNRLKRLLRLTAVYLWNRLPGKKKSAKGST